MFLNFSEAALSGSFEQETFKTHTLLVPLVKGACQKRRHSQGDLFHIRTIREVGRVSSKHHPFDCFKGTSTENPWPMAFTLAEDPSATTSLGASPETQAMLQHLFSATSPRKNGVVLGSSCCDSCGEDPTCCACWSRWSSSKHRKTCELQKV